VRTGRLVVALVGINLGLKLGASEEGSGLLLLNESTEPGVHILAKRTGTRVTLTGKGGQQRVIRPYR